MYEKFIWFYINILNLDHNEWFELMSCPCHDDGTSTNLRISQIPGEGPPKRCVLISPDPAHRDCDHSIESLRFRLVAYSRCASHGRSAPRCALRFRHFFNEGSGELEIWYHKLQVALYMRHIIYKIIFEANNCLGCKDESPATRPFPSQKGKCISYTQVCSPPCTKHLWYSIILSFHHSHSSV